MLRSDVRNKEIALGRIKRLASSGLSLDPLVRSLFELIDDAIPSNPNRTFHVGASDADAYICNSPELNQVIPLHRRFYVDAPPEESGVKFRVNPAILHQRFPGKVTWRHEEITLPHLYKTDGFRAVFKPWGFHHCLMVMFHEGGEFLGSYPIWRGVDQPPFDPNDVRFVHAIAPSVSHGLKVSRLLARSTEAGGSSFQSLPGWGCGMLLVDRTGKTIASDPIADLVFNQLRFLDRTSGRYLPDDINDSVRRIAHRVGAAFSPDCDSLTLAPPVSAIYQHWSGMLLRFRGVRLGGVGGSEYVTILIERGETLAARQKRFRLRWGLSDREAQILALIGEGKSGPDTATLIGISHDTVRKHTSRVLEKLGVETRAGAASIAREAMAFSDGDFIQ